MEQACFMKLSKSMIRRVSSKIIGDKNLEEGKIIAELHKQVDGLQKKIEELEEENQQKQKERNELDQMFRA